MKHRWIAVALTTLGLTTTATAQQQQPYPPTAPPQAGMMPEPLPYAPGPMPYGAGPMPYGAGPMTGLPNTGAWPGSPGGANTPDPNCKPPELPANLPNAFTRRDWETSCAWYTYVGVMGLQRQKNGDGVFLSRDPSTIDTPAANPAAPALAHYSDLTPAFSVGPRVTIGYHWENQALEMAGYYLGEGSKSRRFVDPGRLNMPFVNPPIGFEGNNNLWKNADAASYNFKSQLASVEGNYRWWLHEESTFSWLVGVRYLDMIERVSLLSDDEGNIRDNFGRPDLTRIADYTVRTHNHIVAPQLGLEYNKGLTHWVALSCMAKGAWGLDFSNTNVQLQRGDGLIGVLGNRSDTEFAHLYDLGLSLDWHLSTRARLRTGYNCLWVVGVAEAVDQIDFDLTQKFGERKVNGSVFYHGPSLELQVVF